MKTFPLKLTDELHGKLRQEAFNNIVSIHEYILDAIEQKLNVSKDLPKLKERGGK